MRPPKVGEVKPYQNHYELPISQHACRYLECRVHKVKFSERVNEHIAKVEKNTMKRKYEKVKDAEAFH